MADTPEMALNPGWRSIDRTLPLLIGVLLVGTIAALTVASYLEVRRSAERGTEERLSNVASQFADLFRQSVAQQRQRLAPLGEHDAIAAFADRPTAATREQALAALRALDASAANPDQIVTSEVRDAAGRVLLSTANEPALAANALREVIPSIEVGDSARVGAFALLRDTLVYPAVVPVRDAPEHYVVRWRRMLGSRRQREQLVQLVGSDAAIFLGNARGEGWHNLERPVPRPEFVGDVASDSQRTYTRGGNAHFVKVRPVGGTPWVVAVDFPASGVYEPVSAFLRRVALIAGMALLVGLVAAWMLSRRITRPLVELTHAAEGIAAGAYGQRVHAGGGGEIGRLAEAFSAMSTEVQRTRDNLEHLVRQRTRELEDAQEALVRRERLAMLGQLSSGVGHELRNPLGVMTNSVYFLRMVLQDAQPKVHEYLDIMSQQIALSEKIVSDLLDFARQKPPQRRPTALPQVAEVQLDRMGKRDGLRVALHLPPDLPDVLVDPIHAGQIVFNLLTNASQAMEGGGRVEVRAVAVEGRVELTVGDTGPGIPAENMEKIFEPLFTTKARGIGLGLAVSRTLARANGGDLRVASAPGQGASFTLSLEAVSKGVSAVLPAGRTVSGGVT